MVDISLMALLRSDGHNMVAICMDSPVNAEMRHQYKFNMAYPHGVTDGNPVYSDLLKFFAISTPFEQFTKQCWWRRSPAKNSHRFASNATRRNTAVGMTFDLGRALVKSLPNTRCQRN